jgi:hypothetical protein
LLLQGVAHIVTPTFGHAVEAAPVRDGHFFDVREVKY